jgi:hypothetical protein
MKDQAGFGRSGANESNPHAGTFRALLSITVLLITALPYGDLVSSAQQVSKEPCEKRLVTRLQKARTEKGDLDWRDRFQEGKDFSIYDETEVRIAGSLKGWFITAGCSDAMGTILVWVPSSGTGRQIQAPLSLLGDSWDFLNVQKVGDFDGDGSMEALVVQTGGAGMYYHYPILLRLGADERWQVIFASKDSFFYGSTEVLPAGLNRTIRLAITSVDRDAPWAFVECTLCSHPYKREEFSVLAGRLELLMRAPILWPLASVSDLIMAARNHNVDEAYRLLATGAIYEGTKIDNKESLTTALTISRLAAVDGDCYEKKEDKKQEIVTETVQGKKVAILGGTSEPSNLIRFECPTGEIGAEYTAEVVPEGKTYLIKSLTLDRLRKY